MAKLPYQITSKVCCTNCNKPLKQNVVLRKKVAPKYCYWCFILLVKQLTRYDGKLVNHIVARNVKTYRK